MLDAIFMRWYVSLRNDNHISDVMLLLKEKNRIHRYITLHFLPL